MHRSLRLPMLSLVVMWQCLALGSSFVLHHSPLPSFSKTGIHANRIPFSTAIKSSSDSHIHADRVFTSSRFALRPSRTSSVILASQPLSKSRLSTRLRMASSSPLRSSLGNRRFPTPSWQVTALCLVGVGLTLYALRVESLAKASQDFKAACDFGSWASCTRVAKSPFGTGLGLIDPHGPLGFLAWSNALYGLLYYLALLLLQLPSLFPLFKSRALALLAAGGSLLTSAYLAVVLFFVLKDMCVVCVACYAVNTALFFLVLRDYKSVVKAIRGKA